jgi:hypothetical protein
MKRLLYWFAAGVTVLVVLGAIAAAATGTNGGSGPLFVPGRRLLASDRRPELLAEPRSPSGF